MLLTRSGCTDGADDVLISGAEAVIIECSRQAGGAGIQRQAQEGAGNTTSPAADYRRRMQMRASKFLGDGSPAAASEGAKLPRRGGGGGEERQAQARVILAAPRHQFLIKKFSKEILLLNSEGIVLRDISPGNYGRYI